MSRPDDDFNLLSSFKPRMIDNPYDSQISIHNQTQKFNFKESTIKPKNFNELSAATKDPSKSKSKEWSKDWLQIKRSSSVKWRLKGISNNDQLFNWIIKAGLFLVNKNKVFNATTKLDPYPSNEAAAVPDVVH